MEATTVISEDDEWQLVESRKTKQERQKARTDHATGTQKPTSRQSKSVRTLTLRKQCVVNEVVDVRHEGPHTRAKYTMFRRKESPYRPLRREVKEIRVLALKPGNDQDELDCRLIYWPLTWAGHHRYETISYCWGDEYDELHIEGARLTVPSSAKQALYRCRYRDRDRHLWIDCICLDQSNNSEKAYQIAQMHHIYKNGLRNLVWLGEDDGTAAQAIEAMKLLRIEFEKEAAQVSFWQGLNKLTIKINQGEFSDVGTIDFDLEPIVRMITKPLFFRLWIVQEVSLSKDNVVLCGHCQVSMTTVHRATQWLEYKRRHLPGWSKISTLVRSASRLSYYADDDCNWYRLRLRVTVSDRRIWNELLRDQWKYRVKDPRDRIYGLLGMYQHYSGTDILPGLLKPDYSLSMLEIYANATRHAIESSRSLGILKYVRPHLRDNNNDAGRKWPSWLPCWHQPSETKSDEAYLGHWFRTNHTTSVLTSNIAGPLPTTVLLKGFRIDCGDGSQVSHNSRVGDDSSLDSMAQFLGDVFTVVRTGLGKIWLEIEQELTKTLIAGENGAHKSAQPENCKGLAIFVALLGPVQDCLSGHWEHAPLDEETLKQASFKQVESLYRACEIACRRRRFFVTKAGRMGLGPQCMEVDDIIAVLWGSKWPVVLRPLEKQGTYEFVGLCYVYGIMFGEAVTEHEREDRPDEEFVIL